MKTLSLNIELSQLAMEATTHATTVPAELLSQARQRLSRKINQLGQFVACQLHEQRSIGADLNLECYDLQYEHKTLRMRFIRFQPRGTWEMQSFQWVA